MPTDVTPQFSPDAKPVEPIRLLDEEGREDLAMTRLCEPPALEQLAREPGHRRVISHRTTQLEQLGGGLGVEGTRELGELLVEGE